MYRLHEQMEQLFRVVVDPVFPAVTPSHESGTAKSSAPAPRREHEPQPCLQFRLVYQASPRDTATHGAGATESKDTA